MGNHEQAAQLPRTVLGGKPVLFPCAWSAPSTWAVLPESGLDAPHGGGGQPVAQLELAPSHSQQQQLGSQAASRPPHQWPRAQLQQLCKHPYAQAAGTGSGQCSHHVITCRPDLNWEPAGSRERQGALLPHYQSSGGVHRGHALSLQSQAQHQYVPHGEATQHFCKTTRPLLVR